MDLKQLEAFAYVVETGGFSRAAELLHLTQPTVSAHVAALERELKLTLIVRTTKETYPTDAGRLLYEYAGQMLTLRNHAKEALVRFAGEMRGTVVIAASTIPGRFFLPPLLGDFQRRYAEVTFDLRMTDSRGAVSQVESREVEIGFCGTLTGAGKCVFREFAEDRLVVITPDTPAYRRYIDKGFPARQVLRESFVSREDGSGTRRETELFLREMGVDVTQLRRTAWAVNNEEVERLVGEGQGVAILSKSAAAGLGKNGGVLTLEFRGAKLRRKLYILRRKNSVLSPTAQAFYRFAEEYYHL